MNYKNIADKIKTLLSSGKVGKAQAVQQLVEETSGAIDGKKAQKLLGIGEFDVPATRGESNPIPAVKPNKDYIDVEAKDMFDTPAVAAGGGMFDRQKRDYKGPAMMAAGAGGIGAGIYGLSQREGESGEAPPLDMTERQNVTVTATVADDKEAEKVAKATPEEKPRALVNYTFNAKLQPYKDIDPKIAEEYKQKVGEAGAMLDAAMTAYKKEKDQAKSGQLWESIVHGLGTMVAGIIGLRTGTDMSGVKFEKSDWNAQLQAAKDELQASISASDRKMAEADTSRKMATQEWDSANQLISRRNAAILDKARGDLSARYNADQVNQAGERLDETVRHNKALEQLSDDKTAAEALKIMSKGDDSKKKALLLASEEFSKASKAKKRDEREALMERGKMILKQAGLPSPELTEETGLIFKTEGYRDPTEVIKQLNQMLGPDASAPSQEQPSVVKKFYNKVQNKTKFVYSDGSEKTVDGQQ